MGHSPQMKKNTYFLSPCDSRRSSRQMHGPSGLKVTVLTRRRDERPECATTMKHRPRLVGYTSQSRPNPQAIASQLLINALTVHVGPSTQVTDNATQYKRAPLVE